jgi:RNA polymerase sigma-70 factor (ECF subfamily)
MRPTASRNLTPVPASPPPEPADRFAALARRHQRAALGYARALLGNRAAAEDAVQDALVDALIHFDQLADEAAFGGWLRRIVHKHCDRQRRRARPGGTGDAVEDLGDPNGATPTGSVERREAADQLRRALEDLPEPERVVVALHYLAGEPIARVADFVGVPVGTVKKRLFTARERLRRCTADRAGSPTPAPPRSEGIELFLAVRAGDRDRVRHLLAAHLELLEAEEAWDDAEALRAGFTLAHRATPLIVAAGRGDLPMVELLLGLGARPDARCGCRNGETALWAASRAGHRAVADRLRAAGAAAAARSHGGLDADDLATWRDALGGPDAPRSCFGPAADGHLQTGIRALDLWLPLAPGDVVRVVAAAETGLMVLLAELSAWAGLAGGRAIWTGFEVRPWQRGELRDFVARSAIERHVDLRIATRADQDRAVLDAALAHGRSLRATGRVLHVIHEREEHEAAVDAAWPGFRAAADLTLVVRPWSAVTRGAVDLPKDLGPHDAVLCTDPGLAARGIYPAIDPLRSRSRRPDDPRAARARALLRDAPADPRAARLLEFLAQPFVTAMPDTGRPGFAAPRQQTLEAVDRILAGRAPGPA